MHMMRTCMHGRHGRHRRSSSGLVPHRHRHRHVALLLLAVAAAVLGRSEDEQYNWDDDRLVSLNLDGPDWNERNLVPIQCVRMNGEEMMVYTMYDNDRHEYEVAPTTYDDDANYNNNNANDDYNYNNNGNYNNNNYGDDDAAVGGGNDDDANVKNYNYDYSAATDDQYYDVYYTDDAANAAATDDDANAAATDDAYAATDDVYGGNAGNGDDDDAYANDDGNNGNNRNRNRKLSSNFSYNKDARCKTQRGTFYAPLADFVRAYSRQRDVNARYMGKRNRVPAAVQYLTCTKYNPYYNNDQDRIRRSLYGELGSNMDVDMDMDMDGHDNNPMSARRSLFFEQHLDENDGHDEQQTSRRLDDNAVVDYTNGKDVYIQVGCLPSTGKVLTFHTYKDDQCKKPLDRYGDNSDSRAILSSIGAQNVNVHFGACHHCVVWPEQVGDDDDASHHSREFVADDDQFWNNHGYDSPMCATVDAYRHRCGVKCRVAMSEKYNGYGHYTRGLTLTGKIFALMMAASVGVCIFLIDRERKGVSTERDPLRKMFGGIRIGTPALCGVAAALVVLSILLELMELKYAFWVVMVSACAMFWAYWWSLYRVGPRKGLLDGQMWLAGNEAGVMA